MEESGRLSLARGCVAGGRTAHELVLSFAEEFAAVYSDVSRHWVAIGLTTPADSAVRTLGRRRGGRVGADAEAAAVADVDAELRRLDAELSRALLRMARHVLPSTVVLLMSDGDEAAAAEAHAAHRRDPAFDADPTEWLPCLYAVVPDWLLKERPAWRAGLVANQPRLVTPAELYRAMQQLAAWPDAPPEVSGSSGTRHSLFEELPASRTCEEAGIPLTRCAWSKRTLL